MQKPTVYELIEKNKDLVLFSVFQSYLEAVSRGDKDAIKKLPLGLLDDCLTSWEKAADLVRPEKK